MHKSRIAAASVALIGCALVGHGSPGAVDGSDTVGQVWTTKVIPLPRTEAGWPHWIGFRNGGKQSEGICLPAPAAYSITQEGGVERSGTFWPEALSPHGCLADRQKHLVLPGESILRLGILATRAGDGSDESVSMFFTLRGFDREFHERALGELEWRTADAESADSPALPASTKADFKSSRCSNHWTASIIAAGPSGRSRRYWVGVRNESRQPRAICGPSLTIETDAGSKQPQPESWEVWSETSGCPRGSEGETALVLPGETSYSLAELPTGVQPPFLLRVKAGEIDASQPYDEPHCDVTVTVRRDVPPAVEK